MENKEQLFDKISDHYSGEGDKETLRRELAGDPGTKDLFNWVDLFWNNLKPRSGHSECIQKQTHKKIERIKHPAFSFQLKIVKYAAIVLLVLCITGIAYYYSWENIPMIVASSSTGQVKTVELPDGSKVWLNAKSSISYPKKFRGKLRKVTVKGEVYFKVKHDIAHPFVVYSNFIEVKVLGTSFMVSNYDNEPTVDTYLSEGSVELELKKIKKVIKMIPGDEVFFDKKTDAIIKENRPHSVFDSWRYGKISFYDESLYKIVRELERKFGKIIHIRDESIGNMKYTADFGSENLEEILNFFSESSNIKYKVIKNGYIITKK